MPLILAIVVDPHEAAQLGMLIQGRLSVDLVQAAEVGEGLLALDDRIPDLILTSPLMSPFDDGVLDEYLRDLGTAGAHVQTLRIPVLSQAPKKKQRLGFSLRRRSKPEPPTLEGCEPKVFADEIEQYLARAAEEKLHASSHESSAGMARDEVSAPAIAEEEWTPAYDPDPPAEHVSWSAPEPEGDSIAWRSDLLDRPPVDETPAYDQAEIETAYASPAIDPVEPLAVEEEPITYVPADSYEVAQTYAEAIEPAPPVHVMETAAPPVMAEAIAEPEIEELPVVAAVPVVEVVPVVAAAAVVEAVAVVEEPIEEAAQIAETVQIEEAPAAVQTSTPAAPGIDENSVKSTPSFKAALAAIRAAWGKPTRKPGDEPADAVAREASPAESYVVPVRQVAALEPTRPTRSVMPVAEAPVPFEVDLTGAIETLEEPPAEVALQAVPSQRPAHVDAPDAVDVYELSVEPDLRDLETQLLAPLERDGESEVPLAPPVAEQKAIESGSPAESAGDRSTKKKRGTKGTKAKVARQPLPLAQPPASVQDEWGIFDPNRCGFAALVDKLDEVSDEKTEQPKNGNKVRVISFS